MKIDQYAKIQKVKLELSGTKPIVHKMEDTQTENPCWDGYEQRGMKEKNGKMVPNCVPVQNSKEDFVIPDPQADEDQNTYVSRCIGDINAEYPGDQGVAICEGKWRDRNKQQ